MNPRKAGEAKPWTWRQWTVTVLALAALAAISVAGGAMLRHAADHHPAPKITVTHARTFLA